MLDKDHQHSLGWHLNLVCKLKLGLRLHDFTFIFQSPIVLARVEFLRVVIAAVRVIGDHAASLENPSDRVCEWRSALGG